MGFAFPSLDPRLPIAARFRLLARCHNCYRVSSGVLPIPAGEGVPSDREELLDSVLFREMQFECGDCGGCIGTVVGLDALDV